MTFFEEGHLNTGLLQGPAGGTVLGQSLFYFSQEALTNLPLLPLLGLCGSSLILKFSQYHLASDHRSKVGMSLYGSY